MKEHVNRQPNRLINEKSPYLLQHAWNPVSWYPWGEEALAAAAAEDKPIFLSVGYATCHWCHVMERESFEDEATAAILNEHYIAIKVDREERPDIDAIYMDALHAMGRQGGWPLNVFLTPAQVPVFGGTYFPPEPRYGMHSFREILLAISEAWRNNRDRLLESAGQIGKYLADSQGQRPDQGLPGEGCFSKAFQTYKNLFDPDDYGFKTDSRNKFPPSMALSFLMSYAQRTGNAEASVMAEKTLSAMKRGGIYDQLGGGLCRYSTDHHWLVPHFEKMLYDNALFLRALVESWQVSGQAFFREAAYDIISYIRRDMTMPGGGIASAEDADSEGEEGRFYLWSQAEFREVAGSAAGFLESFWHVSPKGVMDGRNILHEDIHARPLTPEEAFNSEQAALIRQYREKLLQRRSSRPKPLRDDKILTSWNSLYIQSLARAGQAFGDPELIKNAGAIHDFICNNLFDLNGRLLRRYRDGSAAIAGYLTDYAELGLASFELFRATGKPVYLARAKQLADEAIRLFSSGFGPFCETGSDVAPLLRRTINGYDGVEPSGNSSMARLLVYLSALDLEVYRYHEAAEGIFRYFKSDLDQHPLSCPALLAAYQAFAQPGSRIILTGARDNPELLQSLENLNRVYLPDALVLYIPPEYQAELQFLVPLPASPLIPEFAAYLCQEMTCWPPVHDWQALRKLLAKPGLDYR